VNTCYDAAGRILDVKQKANAGATEAGVAAVTTYAAHGAINWLRVGPGTGVFFEQVQHNSRLQIKEVGAGGWFSQIQYCPGGAASCTTNNGNVLRQTGSGAQIWDYEYDDLNRLKKVTETLNASLIWHQRYKLDVYGNRWILNDSNTLLSQVEATPRAALETDQSPFNVKNQWTGAQYDAAGNQTTSWDTGTAPAAAKYFYDGENRIRRVEVNQTGLAGNPVEYGYDGEGRRVTRKLGGVVKTVFVYNAMGQLAAEYGETAVMPCATCYLTADHLGSTRVVWGPDGMKKFLDYTPYGEEVTWAQRGGHAMFPQQLYPRAGWQGVSLEFTGKERDAETGLDYFGARYMSPMQGRFLSADEPLIDQAQENAQSWNLYTYARNNPLRFVDPSGRCVRLADGNYNDANTGGRLLFEGACADRVIDDGPIPSPSLETHQDRMMLTLQQVERNLSGPSLAEGAVNAAMFAQVPSQLRSIALHFLARRGTVIVTAKGLQHVVQRHSWKGLARFSSKSIFGFGEDLTSLAKAAEKVSPVVQPSGRLARTVDAGRIIGVDRSTGLETKLYTVITESTGELVTMFPGVP
jgi:RHS repeat-associated protein